MGQQNIEKEIKFKLTDFSAIREKLAALGATRLGTASQKAIRFDSSDDSLKAKGIALRIRSGFDNVLTLKKDLEGTGEVTAREELEIPIGDMDKMERVLELLGFDKKKIMEKQREDWSFNETVISLDRLPFGLYLEIEGENEKIIRTAQLLGLDWDQRINGSYWDLYEDYKQENNLMGDDIIFEKSEE